MLSDSHRSGQSKPSISHDKFDPINSPYMSLYLKPWQMALGAVNRAPEKIFSQTKLANNDGKYVSPNQAFSVLAMLLIDAIGTLLPGLPYGTFASIAYGPMPLTSSYFQISNGVHYWVGMPLIKTLLQELLGSLLPSCYHLRPLNWESTCPTSTRLLIGSLLCSRPRHRCGEFQSYHSDLSSSCWIAML
jgi:hypothetical protein